MNKPSWKDYLFTILIPILITVPGVYFSFSYLYWKSFTIQYTLINIIIFLFSIIFPIFLTVIVLSIVALINILHIFLYYKYGLIFQYGILRIALHNLHFYEEFYRAIPITDKIYFVAAFIFIFLFLIMYINSLSKVKNLIKYKLKIIIMLTLTPLIIILIFFHNKDHDFYSYAYLYQLTKSYYKDLFVRNKLIKEKQKIIKDLEKSTKNNHTNHDNIIVVIIGESASKHHFSLYGYNRNTNPNLTKLKNMYIFKNVISPANSTVSSLIITLSHANFNDLSLYYKKPTIIGETRLKGYYTIYISNAERVDFRKEYREFASMTSEANELIELNLYGRYKGVLKKDHEILPYFKKALHMHNNKPKLAIFIHTHGSHQRYERRLPKEKRFHKFTPEIGEYEPYSVNNKDKVINTYDNTILYTDYIISEIIELLKKTGKAATLVYFSDHGQLLYADGLKNAHGYAPPHWKEVEIPLFVWRSEKRRCQNPLDENLMNSKINNVNFLELYNYINCFTYELNPRTLWDNRVMTVYNIYLMDQKRTHGTFAYKIKPEYLK